MSGSDEVTERGADDPFQQQDAEDLEQSKKFWLELASQKMTQLQRERAQDNSQAPSEQDILSEALGDILTPMTPSDGAAFSRLESKMLVRDARDRLEGAFSKIDEQTQRHMEKILESIRAIPARESSNAWVEKAAEELVFAAVFGAEASLVPPQSLSRTHALACSLFAVLRPGDELLTISGPPFDALNDVLGNSAEEEAEERSGSLRDFGMGWDRVELTPSAAFDYNAIEAAVTPQTKMIHIQRSGGSQWRPAIAIEDMAQVVSWIKQEWPHMVVLVDNTFGEFVEDSEPSHIGADLVVGSLGPASSDPASAPGGYILGQASLVTAVRRRLTSFPAPGSVPPGHTRAACEGLLSAAASVGEAVKGTALVVEVMAQLGYESMPPRGARRADSVVALRLADSHSLRALSDSVERNGPLSCLERLQDATNNLAASAQTSPAGGGGGAERHSRELTLHAADQPPYVACCQGGTHWSQWATVLEEALQSMRPRPSAFSPEEAPGDRDMGTEQR